MKYSPSTQKPPSPNTMTDEQLACSAQAGCVDAFDQLLRRFQQRVYHFIYRKINHEHDAQDLTQETFTRAWQYLKTYKPKWRFSTWLYTIAYRLTVSHYARQKHTQPLESAFATHAHTDSPDKITLVNEQRDNIWATVKRHLSDDQYTAMWLRYGEQMSVKEVAHIMDKSLVSMKVQLLRSRRKIEPYILDGVQTKFKSHQSFGVISEGNLMNAPTAGSAK